MRQPTTPYREIGDSDEPEAPRYCAIRVGPRAAAQRDRVTCAWLGWAGADKRLAHVRIIHSTVPGYRSGQEGLVPRERLILPPAW